MKLLKYFPQFEPALTATMYKTELELIKGTSRSKSSRPSIIHFSFNKAATQYVQSILVRCALENGMLPVNMNAYSFNTDFPFLESLTAGEMERYQHVFKKNGYLYSVFGGMVEAIPQLDDYKTVFVVRDPRDILVSLYYSIAYSHSLPSKHGNKHEGFQAMRNAVRQLTIDEFVVSKSDKIASIFSRYRTHLLNEHKNVFITKYEHIIADFQHWLTDLLEYCELDVSKMTVMALLEEHERLKPQGENIHRHIRKGQSGDYLQKLLPETVGFLNDKFATVLSDFDYN